MHWRIPTHLPNSHGGAPVSALLYRIAHWIFDSRRLVVGIWLAVVVVAGAGAGLLNQGTANSFSIPGTESQRGLDQLAHTFPQVAGSTASLVVVAPDGAKVTDDAVKAPIGKAVTTLGAVSGIAGVSDPFGTTVAGGVSADQSAAVVTVQLSGATTEVSTATKNAIQAEAAQLETSMPAGSTVSLGGDLFATALPAFGASEGLGIIIAFFVLAVTFGSFLAAGLPLLTALLGVGLSMAAIFISTIFGPVSSTTPLLALMLGLAVGIDYSLFIISRHIDQLKSGMEVRESAARSVATAGSAVVFAGTTVVIALCGLAVAGIPFLTTMGIGAAVSVAIAVVIALTLTPALLGFVGLRLLSKKRRAAHPSVASQAPVASDASEAAEGEQEPAPAEGSPRAYQAAESSPALGAHHDSDSGVFARWVRAVTRYPVAVIVAVVAVLGLMTVPAASLKLALPDAGWQATGTPARTTYDLLAKHFGAGYNGPLIVTGTIVGSTDPVGLMGKLKTEIEAMPDVASVPLATPNQTADTGILQVIPRDGPDSDSTKQLVQDLRDKHDYFQNTYGVDLAVTGQTAVAIDISALLGSALVPFGILVVGLSLILLMMVFRSIWVPVTATLGFLLSVGASLGAVGAVFNWGWFNGPLHVTSVGSVISFMPIILMGVLFGLAMDYEVFLVSRMRENYVHGESARRAVATGFQSSAKVVTAAALIMFSVFAAFVPEGDTNIKPIALGLAVGIAVDAFIVRMTLMPALLHLLGDRAWGLPRWLDRLLPSFDIEGEDLVKELAVADWPEPGATDALSSLDLAVDVTDAPLLVPGLVRVPAGGSLVVTGADSLARTSALVTLAGRLAPAGGTLKVLGYALPVRAGAVRAKAVVADLSRTNHPVAELSAALRSRPALVVVDGLDSVRDPAVLGAVRAELDRHRATADRPLAIVVATAHPAELTSALGLIDPVTVELVPAPPGWSAAHGTSQTHGTDETEQHRHTPEAEPGLQTNPQLEEVRS